MAETYLNLGNTQIDQLSFLDTAASNVQAYVADQPWSKKKKERFLNAYTDIISKGINGASSNSGIWSINTNENIDFESLSKKDQEIYSEAAYFLLNQMNSITPKDVEEEKKKLELPLYDANFNFGLIKKALELGQLGGRELFIGGDKDNWNYLDERGDNGLRGTTQRALKLSSALALYANLLEEGKYNFEGTTYKDINDLKTRLLNASNSLKRGVIDLNAKEALNLIGIDWRDFFNDGSGDIAGYLGDTPITYAQLAALKLAEEQKKTAAATLPPVATPPPTTEEKSNWLTRFTKSLLYNDYKENISKINEEKRKQYLKSGKEGLTSAEWQELAAIGFDIASIVDPEMISAGALALAGSGLRNIAAYNQPGGMSTSDVWWQVADYGLSVLGSIPVLGDSALAYRALNNLKKAIVPLGVVMAGANVPQAAKAAYDKVVKGEDLTIQDWRAIGAVLTAAVGMGRGRQISKRAEALRRTGGGSSSTVKEGSIKTDKGEITGLSETTTKELLKSFKKAGNDNAAKTDILRKNPEVQAKAKEQNIKLDEASITSEDTFRNRLPQFLRKKPSEVTFSERTEVGSGNRTATLRAMSEYNKNHGWLARKGLAEQDWIFRKTGGYSSTPHTGLWQSVKNYLGKSKWDDFGLKQSSSLTPNNTGGTNNTSGNTNGANNTNGNANGTNNVNGANGNGAVTGGTNNNVSNAGINLPASARESLLGKKIMKRYKDVLSGKFSKRSVQEGKYDFDGVKALVVKNYNGTYDLYINGKRTDAIKDLNKKELNKLIASLLLEHRASLNKGKSKDQKISTKEMGKILLDLKRKGWLKQGGQLGPNLDTVITEFLNKLK